MKYTIILLITLCILVNAALVKSQTPNLKFITKFNDISLQNMNSFTINIGDTILFTYEDSEIDVSYLNICFDNKCLQFTNLEIGIPKKKRFTT
jgi:hypothetical protein